MQESQVWFLGWEDALEKEMATHSSLLTWEIPWTEGPGGLQSMRLQRVRHDWEKNHLSIISLSIYQPSILLALFVWRTMTDTLLLLLLSCFSRIWLCVTPWTVAHQAPMFMGFPRQELEWVAISFSRASSWSRDQTRISCIAGRFFTTEPPGKPP